MNLCSAAWLFTNIVMSAALETTNTPTDKSCESFLRFLPLYNPSECCGREWISYNKTSLEVALNNKLSGQHLAFKIILKTVTRHMENPDPEKPLALSFHGSTGSGKSFVSRLTAESIYQNGMKSRFVHLFIATIHFPHKTELETYKGQLQQWVRGNITECPHSMFIFDEMDKMHPGLIDAIKPYLDFHDNIDGVSYRQAIFIFLSNAGGSEIAKVASDFWRKGQKRENIQLMDLEKNVTQSVINNERCGFWHSNLFSEGLIDFYVPFLPLEYKHVVACGLTEMAARGMKPDQDVVERMAKDHVYEDKERIFSSQGCKMVAKRLDFYL